MRRHKRKPDKKYLSWIHTQPCICAPVGGDCRGPVHAHHAGMRGLMQKAPDNTTVPLCQHHHLDSPLAIHCAGKNFWDFWGLDKDAEIARLQALYAIEQS